MRQFEEQNKETLFRSEVVLTANENEMAKKSSVEKTVHIIRRRTRKEYSAEDKIHIVFEDLLGEDTSVQYDRCRAGFLTRQG